MHIKSFLTVLKTQFGLKVRQLRTDNKTECFNEWCAKRFFDLGIINQSNCIQTPQENEIEKTKHKHLLNVGKVLSFQACLPIKYWGFCILIACYVINLIRTAVVKGHFTYEFLYRKKPSITHLRSFGCECYATNLTIRINLLLVLFELSSGIFHNV